jgi:hypothetical protein
MQLGNFLLWQGAILREGFLIKSGVHSRSWKQGAIIAQCVLSYLAKYMRGRRWWEALEEEDLIAQAEKLAGAKLGKGTLALTGEDSSIARGQFQKQSV